MGFLREKYTVEYFTGRDTTGRQLDYGALGAEEWREGRIFPEIREPLDLAGLRGTKVLEIGYGRGESARYLLNEKGVNYYVGIDFSESAYRLAKETLAGIDPARYRIEMDEALDFLKQEQFDGCFSCVFMLDVIEHIPVAEVGSILPLVYRALRPGGSLVVTTPFYAVDEDYLAQGEVFLEPSPSDDHPMTRGMHCNKYTKERLFQAMRAAGFLVSSDRIFRRPRFDWLYNLLHRLGC